VKIVKNVKARGVSVFTNFTSFTVKGSSDTNLGRTVAEHHSVQIETSPLVRRVIGCAITVHRALGPGLLESAHGHCLAQEMAHQGIEFLREHALPIPYRGTLVDCGYRVDFVVAGELLLEIKSVEALHAIHHAQVLTYLKLSGIEQGLLINFNTQRLVDGLKSLMLRREPGSPKSFSP
jgi:GxxExxY protein